MTTTKTPSPAHRDAILAAALAIPEEDARALRLCSRGLSRWAERLCGWNVPGATMAYEVDDETGRAYLVTMPHRGTERTRKPIRNEETVFLARAASICARLGLYYYHQGDPRGAALYVGRAPMTASDYDTRGRAVY